MAKGEGRPPAFQFYVKDWLSDVDLRQATLTSRGVWIDVLCNMWLMPERNGQLVITPRRLARLCCGGDIDESLHFLNDLWDLGFGDIEFIDEDPNFPLTSENNNTKITLTNRRMHNEYLKRVGGAERQAKFREKGGGDPARWTAIRVPILERDEYMCAYCGRKADTVDHVFPKSKGGDESDENLVACCKRCNMKKNNRTPEEAGMTFWKGYLKLREKNNTKSNTNTNTKITPPSSSSSSSSKKYKKEFEVFYKKYPLKKGKEKALQAYLKHQPDLDVVLKAIENQSKEKSRLKSKNEFCPEWPHPASWINGKRWEDETRLVLERPLPQKEFKLEIPDDMLTPKQLAENVQNRKKLKDLIGGIG